MTQQEYMNITAAARKLGVSRQRVYALIKQKRLSLLDKKGLGKVISSIEIEKYDKNRKTNRRGKQQPKPKQKRKVNLPVEPLPNLLPLMDLNTNWENFENFCLDFVSCLSNIESSNKYGGRGSKQKGIDIEAITIDGEVWIFQAKRWKKFAKRNVEKAISDTTYQANRYILLVSTEVSASARQVCNDDNNNWSIWDVQDISKRVRYEIPKSEAKTLVKTHFSSEWCKAFLGVMPVSPFLPQDNYYAELNQKNHLLSHSNQIVGRQNIINELVDFVNNNTETAAILSGRGGIGKSKIIHSFVNSKSINNYEVRFVEDTMQITPEILTELPEDNVLFIIDDAHNFDNLNRIISILNSKYIDNRYKLILACRPQNVSAITNHLINSSIDPRGIRKLPELNELGLDDNISLITQILSNNNRNYIERIAQATKDSPLIAVITARLIETKALDASIIDNHDNFRQIILTKFNNELLGDLAPDLNRVLVKNLLEIVAAISPVDLKDKIVLQSISEFLEDTSVDKILHTLYRLENYGVLLRRGYKVRITPDVLSDYTLNRIALDHDNRLTSFAKKLFDSFYNTSFSNLMRNFGLLDWKIKVGGKEDVDILDEMWQRFFNEYANSTHCERINKLKKLEKASYFQPKRILDLIEYEIDNPSRKPDESPLRDWYSFDHSDVIRKLPDLLKNVCYNGEYLSRACDLLWKIGQNDKRELHSHCDHGVRILSDLAKYDPNKPIGVNETVLNKAIDWLDSNQTDSYHTPLSIIEPMLNKTGHTTTCQGPQFVMSPFLVNYKNTKNLRIKVIDAIFHCLESSNPKLVSKSLDLLSKALRPPIAILNMSISKEGCQQWLPEEIYILDKLMAVLKSTSNLFIKIEIYNLAYNIADSKKNEDKEVISLAENILKVLSANFDLEFCIGLAPNRCVAWFKSNYQIGEDAHWLKEADISSFYETMTKKFLKKFSKPEDGYEYIEIMLTKYKDHGFAASPYYFLNQIACADEKYAGALAKMFIDRSDSLSAFNIASLINRLRHVNPEEFYNIVDNSFKANKPNNLLRSLSCAYIGWASEANNKDVPIIKRFLESHDPVVKTYAIRCLGNLYKSYNKETLSLILETDLEDNSDLVKEACTIINKRYGIPFEELPKTVVSHFLKIMESIPSIDEYSMLEFLDNVSISNPIRLVKMILKRIKEGSNRMNEKLTPLPYGRLSKDITGFNKSDDYEEIIRMIMSACEGVTHLDMFWYTRFYELVVRPMTAIGKKLLRDWIFSNDTNKIIKASYLVKDYDYHFLFEHKDLIEDFLKASHEMGEDCFKYVSSNLMSIAYTGIRSGVPGQPMAKDVAIKKQAEAESKSSSSFSLIGNFFRSIERGAGESIDNQLARDEETFDEKYT